MRSVFVHSEQFSRFKAYQGYPWQFKRGEATHRLCERLGLLHHDWMTVHKPKPASTEEILTFHTEEYVTILKKANKGVSQEEWLTCGLGTMECPVYKGVYDYHALAAGGTLLGMDLISGDRADRVFCPTGGFHHAGKDFASGFCYLNDIVMAIKKALCQKKRVLFVDIDAHHGDQVQAAFYRSSRVMCLSFHESGETLFPFKTGFEDETGKGHGKGYTINVPLPENTSDQEFTWAFEEVFLPVAKGFNPDIVVAALGVDVLFSDPFSHLKLTNLSFSQALERIVDCSPKLLALGCGGYVLEDMARTWTLAWAIMNGLGPKEEDAAMFGGAFWGDDLTSLRDRPLFVPEDVRKKTTKSVRRVVGKIKKVVFPVLDIKP
ncbi:MAG: acetoin utilization protein AcuC [Thermodesulfobacteriota bacterium]|nr:acetoin utilization protein AcuC [Thermodesulfobacteriota bacterium]